MIRVAINGFGRIGRQILQAGINDPEIEWVAVNDLTDTKTLAYLLKYDSVQQRETKDVVAEEDSIIVNGKKILVFAEKDPEKLPWAKLNIDIVIESTGFFTERAGAEKHIKAGAKKVLISAPSKDADISVVMGVNEHLLKAEHKIISNCSCTTNAAAPLAKVINDNFLIEKGFIITSHAYTATQKLVDAPDSKDLRRGRSAAVNIVPSTTGAAEAVVQTIPELKGKLDGFALRVPVPTGSIVTLVAIVKKATTKEELNWLFGEVSKYHMKGIVQYVNEPIVSTDIIHNPHSCIFDSLLTKVTDNNLVSVTAWYDNEWGYSCRMVDMIKKLGLLN
ncbi:MAG: type I glyceraldehyde-3-phosphate dehydrogenase [Candidatus Woesearchaeota archaeon]